MDAIRGEGFGRGAAGPLNGGSSEGLGPFDGLRVSGRGGGGRDEPGLRQARDERGAGEAPDAPPCPDPLGLAPGRRDRVWSEALGEAFLALVRETGNARAAARALGHPNLFLNRMRRDRAFRERYRAAADAWVRAERAAGRPARGRPAKRAKARWSAALGERFVALVRETGNARAAAIALGAPNAFNNRMKRDPAFRARVLAAAAEADGRLRPAESAFPLPPPSPSPSLPPGGARRRLPTDVKSLGGYLRPGRKPQGEAEPVIRRNSKGRLQVTLTREGHWTSRIECEFLARLAATGNFEACAVAVGFQPNSVHERVKKWPAFARDCERALAEADTVLAYKLAAFAHASLRRPGEAEAAGIEEPEAPFDPKMAMKILSHLDSRRFGRSGKGGRKGPPERTFEQACASILAKIEAIERHEKLSRESGTFTGEKGEEKGEEGSPPCKGGER